MTATVLPCHRSHGGPSFFFLDTMSYVARRRGGGLQLEDGAGRAAAASEMREIWIFDTPKKEKENN